MKVVGARRVWSLEEVTGAIAARFEDVRAFWVEAEIEDIRAAGGQVYFRLRGEHVIDASIRQVVFDRISPRPVPGALVHAHGRVEFFRARSRVSMRVEVIELAGEGLLQARIDELRERLRTEGLLRLGAGRPLPMLPRRIALVTSPVGAARDDFLRNAEARFPGIDVVVVPTLVQGDGAPAAIARALARAVDAPRVDVVVITRGGGSLDDLMAFNSEPVCRAVAECRVPVVSAVGHERDHTLCDEVADLRVSTPTAAAIAVVPSREALDMHLADASASMRRGLDRAATRASERVEERMVRLRRALRTVAERGAARVEAAGGRLSPAVLRIAAEAERASGDGRTRLRRAIVQQTARAEERIASADALLRTLSPAATMARGYAIVRDGSSGRIITDAAGLAKGDRVIVQLRSGRIATRVEGIDG